MGRKALALRRICGTLLLGGTAASVSYAADVLWEQPVDFLNRWDSFYSPTGIQFGDEYLIEEPVVVQSATFWMVATWPNVPWTWSLTIHDGTYNHRYYDFAPRTPYIFRMLDPSTVTDLGPWPTDANLHLFEVRFDNINLLLEPYLDDERAYWFSCAGFLANYPIDRCYWATAGDGVINGDMGYFKYEPPNDPWRLMSNFGLPPSDFAFRIKGVPADEYEPTTQLKEARIEWGDWMQGDVESLRTAGDDDIFELRAKGRGPGPYRRAIVDTQFQCLVQNPDVLDVSVNGAMYTAAWGSAVLSLRNWSTGEFEEVGIHLAGPGILSWPIRDVPAAGYIREDGVIDLRVEYNIWFGTVGRSMTGGFRTEIDRVDIEARYED